MHFAFRLQMAAAFTVLLSAQAALAQNAPILPLNPKPAHIAVKSLSYKTLGKVGSRDSQSQNMTATLHSASPAVVPGIPSPGFYPGDLNDYYGGAVVVAAKQHPIYVDAAPATWGDVPAFLSDYSKSNMIHIVDQYTGSDENNRYRLGSQFAAPHYPLPSNHTFTIDDILTLVHAGASVAGNGYGHMYHVFLPPGADMCSGPAGTAPCYSPDDSANWVFCAFHGSVDFDDAVGHVLFSVEPFQNVLGCSVAPTGTANNQLIDSTDSTLSHEVTETITDPDGDAWWVQDGTALFGAEIADECTRAAVYPDYNVYGDYGIVRLNGHPYTIQPEYSNAVHGCTYRPTGERE